MAFQLLFGWELMAQSDVATARELFKAENYLLALTEYHKLIKKDSTNEDYNYYIGICYLKTNIDKVKAIPYLEKVTKTSSRTKFPDAPFYLGEAYALDYRFDDAIESFKRFKTNLKSGMSFGAAEAERRIAKCQSAMKLMEMPLVVYIENVKELNTIFADYYPYVANDGSWIIFNSHHNVTRAVKEEKGSDVFVSKLSEDKSTYGEKKPMYFNTKADEKVVGMSVDGEAVFVRVTTEKGDQDLHLSYKDRKRRPINNFLNSKYNESSGCLTTDGNTLIFSSNRKGGMGGYDLYMSRKLPTGDWSMPQNLGSPINTPGDEEFPQMTLDGKTMYFSSNGQRLNMGGYDLYKTVWNFETNIWKEPQNMGYPINTPNDEKTIIFTNTGVAYISGFRKDSKGDLDIYKITW